MSLENMSPEEIEKLTKMGRWAESILGNPETRADALRLTKKVNPGYVNPEIELQDRIDEARKSDSKKFDEMNERLLAQDISHRRDLKRRELKDKGFDIDAVEKVMTDKKIGDYDTAMQFMAAESKLAPATPSLVQGATKLPTNFKDIMKNPTQWARDEAAKVLNEAAAAARNI